MPRSYSYDHFTAQNSQKGKGSLEEDKQHLAQEGAESKPSQSDIHYGKRFAETEQRGAAKAEARAHGHEDEGPSAHVRLSPEDGPPWLEAWEHAKRGYVLSTKMADEMGQAARALLSMPVRMGREMWGRVTAVLNP